MADDFTLTAYAVWSPTGQSIAYVTNNGIFGSILA